MSGEYFEKSKIFDLIVQEMQIVENKLDELYDEYKQIMTQKEIYRLKLQTLESMRESTRAELKKLKGEQP
jgi:hypothetical protein